MKRSSSLNDCNCNEPEDDAAMTPTTPSDGGANNANRSSPASAPSSTPAGQDQSSPKQEQQQFRQWASLSIDRTRMRPQHHQRQQGMESAQLSRIHSASSPTENGGRATPDSYKKQPAKNGDTRESITSSVGTLSPSEEVMRSNHAAKPLDPSVYFMSDPSVSEEDMTDRASSHADFMRKQLYRQKLREFDAHSIGDTSLSSSNISPTPQRFRIQFENSINHSSDQIKNNFGKMRNKIKAASASARMSLTKSLQSESSGKANGDETKLTSPLDGSSEDLLMAALMPPTGSSSGGANADTRDDNSPLHFNFSDQKMISDVPPLPHLDGRPFDEHHNMGEDSQSSADSVRGISITTEQSGGEDTSSSALHSGDTNGFPNMPINGSGNVSGSPPKQFNNNNPTQEDADAARRARRKVSPHRRMRSVGDGRAATIMNFGREDWIGMGMDGIPIPEGARDDDDGSSSFLARKENHSSWSNESSPLIRTNSRGRTSTWDGSRDGYSAGSSAVTSHRNHTRTGQSTSAAHQQHHPQRFIPRNDSAKSHDTFDFSVSDGGGSVTRNNHTYSSSFDQTKSTTPRPWDGGRGNAHHVRYATNMGIGTPPPTLNTPGHRPQMSWLASYQQVNGMGSARSEFPIQNNHRASHESDSDSSSGTDSCTSSSYTDTSERMIEIKQTRRVKFASPGSDTKFDKVMRRVESVLDKPLYRLDKADEEDFNKEMPMFYCPNCKTQQRDFINFATAGSMYDSPQGFLAAYFALYLLSSLFVFGLEEGWQPLDCIYFSVITLTTTGLGDFVPTTNGGKILCACFIYVGVATIGLLLGGLLAGSMDNAHKKEAREAQIRDCPNCLKLEKAALRRSTASVPKMAGYDEIEQNRSYSPSDGSYEDEENIGLDLFAPTSEEPTNKVPGIPTAQKPAQIHTRHMSIDVGGRLFAGAKTPLRRTGSGDGLPAIIDESTPFLGTSAHSNTGPGSVEMRATDDSYSSSSTSTESSANPIKPMTRVKAAKYVFLTLKKALVNSLFIIAAGGFGFYYIEHMSAVDAFYFTTVLLTSVGYGDIVPKTTEGKLFATVFSIVAGTVLLHNMTLISMIPLELRKRRVEHAVLGQFGSQLNDDELRELSTGRLINRLKLATNRPDGLEECTREMFSLAMLVRLGRITEDDVKATFTAFRRLDIGNYGKLNSRTIIEGELMRRKSLKNLMALSPPQEEEEWVQSPQQHTQNYSMDSFARVPYTSDFNIHHGSPNPFMNPMQHPSNGSLTFVRKPSIDSYYSQEMFSRASSVDYEEYERWTQNFGHYSSPRGSGRY